ncbi:damage-inducible protein [Asticcacaulis sp. DW145]|uniref:ImuA family protein n=1 Tax=Asticcacaulis sp. DW145 TaxID=3095608 RepID=UPI0030CD2AAB
MSGASTATIADLRQQLEGITSSGARRGGFLPFGVPEIDRRLPHGGIAVGALHEVAGGADGAVDGAASAAFAAGIAARTGGLVLWCYRRPDLFAPALARSGLSEDKVLFFEAVDEASLVECFELAVSHGSVSAVVAEVASLKRVPSQRLQMAAERSGTMAIALRRWMTQRDAQDFGNPTAAATRWRVTEINSEILPVQGVGRSRWLLELMRCRGGESSDFIVEACDETGGLSIPADLADGQDAADAWGGRAAS